MAADPAPLTNGVAPETHRAACQYRLARVRAQLAANDCAAALLYDPVNIRYATDTSNMQIWTMHNRSRYALIFATGPVIVFDFPHCEHIHDGNGQVDEFRVGIEWSPFAAGARAPERARQWADELAAALTEHAGPRSRVAVDVADFEGIDLLRARGFEFTGGQRLLEEARRIKSADELALIRWTLEVCQRGIQRMHDENRPGLTENELWAWLHFENIRHGGEWIETRLVASGPRTNPWMHECSDRVMLEGELFCFDTDLIGPFGYIADLSRAWTVGHVAPTPAQRLLYRLAHEQIETNMALIKPGVTYRELSEKAWPIPERYFAQRYCYLAHGVGLCDESPGIHHWGADWDRAGYDGVFEENMTLSVESFIGEVGGAEGVKLEQQVLVTANGVEPLSTWPWNDDWL